MSLIAPERPQVYRNAARIERKAETIPDPIERLKYLRQATAPKPPRQRHWGALAAFGIGSLLLFSMRSDAHLRRQADSRRAANTIRAAKHDVPNVWKIEETKNYEVYSNGLRIENQLAVSNEPRSYQLLSVEDAASLRPRTANPSRRPLIPRTQPAGIVFHTTESHQVPFEATEQRNLQRISKDTLLFVRNRRAYHFVIDRFGRIHRIVVESDAANHAGNSVWADSRWLYLELNQSFLGVAFEASMQTDQPPVNEAQIHAGRVLTEMLRGKYNIAAENCVTHAQVSVNPSNMLIGWHCDWGKGFPFREIGLPENYEQPVPSLYLMGFDYDPGYVSATGSGIWTGLALAEERLRAAAESRRISEGQYRTLLQKRYRDEITSLRHRGADEEN